MPKAKSMKELRGMPTAELIETIDNWDAPTDLYLNDHLNELARRDQYEYSQAMQQHSRAMLEHTKQIKWLTLAVVVMTVVVAAATIF